MKRASNSLIKIFIIKAKKRNHRTMFNICLTNTEPISNEMRETGPTFLIVLSCTLETRRFATHKVKFFNLI